MENFKGQIGLFQPGQLFVLCFLSHTEPRYLAALAAVSGCGKRLYEAAILTFKLFLLPAGCGLRVAF